jgi:alpha-D-ribose 1-methylphosphonate 5-triphosphate synthase subunit PhnH
MHDVRSSNFRMNDVVSKLQSNGFSVVDSTSDAVKLTHIDTGTNVYLEHHPIDDRKPGFLDIHSKLPYSLQHTLR